MLTRAVEAEDRCGARGYGDLALGVGNIVVVLLNGI